MTPILQLTTDKQVTYYQGWTGWAEEPLLQLWGMQTEGLFLDISSGAKWTQYRQEPHKRLIKSNSWMDCHLGWRCSGIIQNILCLLPSWKEKHSWLLAFLTLPHYLCCQVTRRCQQWKLFFSICLLWPSPLCFHTPVLIQLAPFYAQNFCLAFQCLLTIISCQNAEI